MNKLRIIVISSVGLLIACQAVKTASAPAPEYRQSRLPAWEPQSNDSAVNDFDSLDLDWAEDEAQASVSAGGAASKEAPPRPSEQ